MARRARSERARPIGVRSAGACVQRTSRPPSCAGQTVQLVGSALPASPRRAYGRARACCRFVPGERLDWTALLTQLGQGRPARESKRDSNGSRRRDARGLRSIYLQRNVFPLLCFVDLWVSRGGQGCRARERRRKACEGCSTNLGQSEMLAESGSTSMESAS